MKRILGRLTYANVMATVAVFIALGGVSYAALKLPKNSVGAKQLKKGAVTPAKLNHASEAALTGPVGPKGEAGARGEKGEPGIPATSLTAQVKGSMAELQLVRGSGAIGVSEHSESIEVLFNREVSSCTYQATRTSVPKLAGEISVGPGLKANGVIVETFDSNGNNLFRSFYLAVFC